MPPPPGLQLDKPRLLVFPYPGDKVYTSTKMTGVDCDLPAPRVRRISASSFTCLESPTVVDITDTGLSPEGDADERNTPPDAVFKAADVPTLRSASSPVQPHEQHICQQDVIPTAGSSPSPSDSVHNDKLPSGHASLIGGEELVSATHPDNIWEMSMSLDAFQGGAEYYSASSDDECTSASEDHDLNHNHPNSLDNPYGEQTKRDDGTMNTRISGALPSRPASRLSNSSSDESSEEVLWIERHFELVTPTTPSFPGHTCEHSPCSHRRDSAEDTNSSDSSPFPDVRFVSLPEQSLPSHSFSSPSPPLSMPSNPEFDHISSSCGDPMPTTPAYTYALGMGHDTTPPVHAPAPSMEPPSSPLRFVARSAVSSANTPVFVAPSPRNNRLQGLTELQQTGGSIEGKPDVSIAIDFVAEHAQTCRPTFTSCITASDHSVSVRTDARVAFDEDPVRLLHEPRGGSSSPTVTLNATRGGAYSRPVSLSRKLGSFMARRLSVNRGRSNSASAGSPVFAPPAPLNTIVYDPSVSPEPNQRSPPINQTSARGPPGDVSIGARKRRYTLVLEVDVDVSENSPAVADAAGPLTRLMRRMSIGRGRQRSATTSFVLASTRVLPVPEHPVERGDIAPDANLDEVDSSNIGVAALTPTNEQMRRWST